MYFGAPGPTVIGGVSRNQVRVEWDTSRKERVFKNNVKQREQLYIITNIDLQEPLQEYHWSGYINALIGAWY